LILQVTLAIPAGGVIPASGNHGNARIVARAKVVVRVVVVVVKGSGVQPGGICSSSDEIKCDMRTTVSTEFPSEFH